MKNKDGIDLLKLLAQQAKNRMKGKTEKSFVETRRGLQVVEKDKVKITTIKLNEEEDYILYGKVCSILDNNANCYNPLDKLIDIKEYNHLSDFGKERYLFNLAEKYRRLKERYNEEKLLKTI